MDMLRSVLDSESSASSSHTKSSSTSSVQDEIRRLEETIRTYSYEPEVNAKHYNMRTLVELTHEQLIRMTQEEIKGIFQMLCRELTAADFFSVKVGVRKENMPAHHHTGSNVNMVVTQTDSACTDLDGRLWGLLPEPLVDLILAHLPIPALFSMRMVCRRWNGLVHSAGFVKARAEVTSELPYYVLYGMEDHRVQIGPALFTFAYFARDASIFCSTARKWHDFSLNFLPFPDFYLILTGGGLLCFAVYNSEDEVTLGVCNPITKTWRELPPWLPLRGKGLPDFVAMVVDKSENSYRVIVIEESDLVTRVYESATRVWKETGSIPASDGLPYLMNRPCQAVVSDGFMYCLSQNVCQIATYNLERGVWSQIQLQIPSTHGFLNSRTLGLVESSGRILVLTRTVTGANNYILDPLSSDQGCFQVWVVNQHLGLDIITVGEVPYKPFDSEYDFDSFNIYSFCTEEHKDALIFSSPEWEYTWLFDLSDGSWHVVPECPREMFGPDGVEGFPMELRLDAMP
ncbi:hypothetical protein CY35_05G085800 [Sphagnum magellanicum]|nr:hypothetical protein CY35_05G085800 [Sphagnum magellanicum]